MRFEPGEQVRGLRCGAWISVKNETSFRVGLAEPLLNQLVDQVVRNQVAGMHGIGDSAPVFRSGPDALTQDFSRRNVWDPQTLMQQLGLSALARTRGAK